MKEIQHTHGNFFVVVVTVGKEVVEGVCVEEG